MRILIGKLSTKAFIYVIGKSNIVLTSAHIIVLDI